MKQSLSGWRIIPPRDHLFWGLLWSAGSERATAAVEASRSRQPPRARDMAAQAEAAPRAGAPSRLPAAAAPGQAGGAAAGSAARPKPNN